MNILIGFLNTTSQRKSWEADRRTQTVKLLTVNIRRLASAGEASAMSKSDQLLARLHNVALGSNNNGG